MEDLYEAPKEKVETKCLLRENTDDLEEVVTVRGGFESGRKVRKWCQEVYLRAYNETGTNHKDIHNGRQFEK
jgi:hypothetical protein